MSTKSAAKNKRVPHSTCSSRGSLSVSASSTSVMNPRIAIQRASNAACTVRACSVHSACVQCPKCVRAACTMRACSVHNACVQRAQCVRAVCTMRACSVHNAGMQRAQCVRAACTVRACSLHNAGVQRAQCVRAHYKHFHQAPIPHLVALTPPCNRRCRNHLPKYQKSCHNGCHDSNHCRHRFS